MSDKDINRDGEASSRAASSKSKRVSISVDAEGSGGGGGFFFGQGGEEAASESEPAFAKVTRELAERRTLSARQNSTASRPLSSASTAPNEDTSNAVQSVLSESFPTADPSGFVAADEHRPAIYTFGGYDLADLINRVLSKLEPTPTDTATDVRLKTYSAIITELGRKLDRAQKVMRNMDDHIAALQRERVEKAGEIEVLKKKVGELEEVGSRAGSARLVWPRLTVTTQGDGDSGGASGRGSARTRKSMTFAEEIVEKRGDDAKERKDFYDPFADETLAKRCINSRITKNMLFDAAAMIAAKKPYDPPTALSIGLKSSTSDERAVSPNPYHHLLKHPSQLAPTSYFPSMLTRLAHHATDHTHHLSQILTHQTHQLLATTSQDDYISVIQSHLREMTAAVHMCLDALAEEHRACERWKVRCVRLVKRFTAAEGKGEVENGGRDSRTGIKGFRKKQYLFNALLPIVTPRKTVRKAPVVEGDKNDEFNIPEDGRIFAPTTPMSTQRLKKPVHTPKPCYVQVLEMEEEEEFAEALSAARAKTAPARESKSGEEIKRISSSTPPIIVPTAHQNPTPKSAPASLRLNKGKPQKAKITTPQTSTRISSRSHTHAHGTFHHTHRDAAPSTPSAPQNKRVTTPALSTPEPFPLVPKTGKGIMREGKMTDEGFLEESFEEARKHLRRLKVM